MQQSEDLVITVLREARAEQQARLTEIENTLAWQVGGLLISMLNSPLRNGVGNMFWLMRLFLRAKRGRGRSPSACAEERPRSEKAFQADFLIYGSFANDSVFPGTAWQTEDVRILIDCLDAREAPGTLVLRRVDVSLVRLLARIQAHGWRLVFWPEEEDSIPPYLLRYVSGLADEVRSEAAP